MIIKKHYCMIVCILSTLGFNSVMALTTTSVLESLLVKSNGGEIVRATTSSVTYSIEVIDPQSRVESIEDEATRYHERDSKYTIEEWKAIVTNLNKIRSHNVKIMKVSYFPDATIWDISKPYNSVHEIETSPTLETSIMRFHSAEGEHILDIAWPMHTAILKSSKVSIPDPVNFGRLSPGSKAIAGIVLHDSSKFDVSLAEEATTALLTISAADNQATMGIATKLEISRDSNFNILRESFEVNGKTVHEIICENFSSTANFPAGVMTPSVVRENEFQNASVRMKTFTRVADVNWNKPALADLYVQAESDMEKILNTITNYGIRISVSPSTKGFPFDVSNYSSTSTSLESKVHPR